jgi:hypothetical protein
MERFTVPWTRSRGSDSWVHDADSLGTIENKLDGLELMKTKGYLGF